MDARILKLQKLYADYGATIDQQCFHLNLIGVRNQNDVNKFNDELHYFYFDHLGNLQLTSIIGEFTTDPGKNYLVTPMSNRGCAILKDCYHENIWKLGYHKGQYKALVQANPCTVYRDNDKDLELDTIIEHTGLFGINLHRANASITSTNINNWSAGCQVLANPMTYAKLMDAVQMAVRNGQVYFSYLLTTESIL